MNKNKNKNKLFKKKTFGGDIIETMQSFTEISFKIIKLIYTPWIWMYSTINYILFRPKSSMPMTKIHMYYLALIIAILLFLFENIIIMLFKYITSKIYLNININNWINFPILYFIMLFYTLFFIFISGTFNKFYLLSLYIIIIILFIIGRARNILHFIEDIIENMK